jgi:hypothetical protein
MFAHLGSIKMNIALKTTEAKSFKTSIWEPKPLKGIGQKEYTEYVCEMKMHAKEIKYFIFQIIYIQEVPAFRDFWFQGLIMKCGDHEFRGLFFSVKPQNGSKKYWKSTFWAFFHKILIFSPIQIAFQSLHAYRIFWNCHA